ncbi:MAG TPA: (2Fe-2S) ferredoxin domain-containing protein [Mariprofundaceae bacterium]|nr:(2Fe-2S) ferredoxin domain-containing protein [Mariprofundaceae bacterium]
MSTESKYPELPTIEVCFGPECSDLGGRELAAELKAQGIPCLIGDCRSQCPNAPLVLVENRMITHATAQKVQDRVKSLLDSGSGHEC